MDVQLSGELVSTPPYRPLAWASYLLGAEHAERHLALCIDDQVLAHGENVRRALLRLRESGRRVVVVSGRWSDEVMSDMGALREVIDAVVCGRGTQLWLPRSGELLWLYASAHDAVDQALRTCDVPRSRAIAVAMTESALDGLRECAVLVATANATPAVVEAAGRITDTSGAGSIREITASLLAADAAQRRRAPPLFDLVATAGDRRRAPRGLTPAHR